ncbi:MAG: ATP-binding protein [Calditrichaceae bacterium]
MHSNQINISLISNNNERAEKFSSLLKDPANKISNFPFIEASRNALFEAPIDIVIIDCVSDPKFNYRNFEPVRSNPKLDSIPFIFVINSDQETIKHQIYKKPQNIILIEPIDKFVFISSITGALHLRKLERSDAIYREIIEGEKKIISYMDEILEMSNVLQFKTEPELIRYLQVEFVRRLELSLAVETAMFANFNSDDSTLSIDFYDETGTKLKKRQSFRLEGTSLPRLINHKVPHIFTSKDTNEPFIQELEESSGFKIDGMLFVPVSIFHQPRAALILINKLYRNEFSESDLAFMLLASQKISFQMERIYLSKISRNEDDRTKIVSIFGNENRIFQEWTFYQQIMSAVDFGMIVFDSNYKVEFMNRKAGLILQRDQNNYQGKSLEEIFGKNEFVQIKTLLSTRDLPLVKEEMQVSIKNLPNYYIGFSIYRHEDVDGNLKYIFVFSEITQTKRIQAEIIRMDRMASLGVLSSGIAHEIRNPLAGIKAMVQTLEEEMEEGSSHLEYVERILRQVNRLDDLLKAFFSYARPQRPEPQAEQIADIVHEVLPLFRRKMKDKNITFKENYTEKLFYVFVDPNQIQQVVFNLFLNAIDAMPEGGEIMIEAHNSPNSTPVIDRRHRMPSLLSNNMIEIRISDTGKGIPRDILDNVFNPFFTTKPNGTGLGLSIVYQIIKEHGGQIEVESVPEKGTLFKILLPALENKIPT